MNKYIFPGADASCALNWVIGQVEGANFEVKSCDVLGVHCSFSRSRSRDFTDVTMMQTRLLSGDGTKTGSRTKRRSSRNTVFDGTESGSTSSPPPSSLLGMSLSLPLHFAATDGSRIDRQGSVSVFQITLHKNLNGYHRIDGVPSHTSLFFTPEKQPTLIV